MDSSGECRGDDRRNQSFNISTAWCDIPTPAAAPTATSTFTGLKYGYQLER